MKRKSSSPVKCAPVLFSYGIVLCSQLAYTGMDTFRVQHHLWVPAVSTKLQTIKTLDDRR
jgi:hypothetical protein